MLRKYDILFLIIFLYLNIPSISPNKNKYSKDANINFTPPDEKSGGRIDPDKVTKFSELNKPFRMSKINLVWYKASQKLSENKLKALYTELLYHDKEELKLKRLKADGQDKEGLMEADVRRKFKGILTKFDLIHLFNEDVKISDGNYGKKHKKYHENSSDNKIDKGLFKDKKLNKLWDKAEKSGFTQEELKTLKEEFLHHQNKIDDYYMLLESLTDEEKNLMSNDIPGMNDLMDEVEPAARGEKKQDSKLNSLTDTHRQIKEGYVKLQKKATSGSGTMEFVEPRVDSLWQLAMKGDFSPQELESLKTELKHYEKRLEKLNHLQSEYLLKQHHKHGKESHHHDKNTNQIYEDKIKRHERTVEKLHAELESKVKSRHSEL